MRPLSEVAPAKVNLTLHVTGRRVDGYHLLDSVVVFAGVGDRLQARPAPALQLSIEGMFARSLTQEQDNLVLRAARMLADHAGRAADVALTLEKRLPVASGIGGGSADAAATLRILARLWDLPPPPQAAIQALGADVPVCLLGQPVRMRGIGEELERLPDLPTVGLLLVNPGVPLATAEVFRARTGAFSVAEPMPAGWADAAALAAWVRKGTNDLEMPARQIRPEIGGVLDAIAARPGCLLARMSGSGATCFGLFPDPDLAARTAEALAHPGWWCWGGALAPEPSGRIRA